MRYPILMIFQGRNCDLRSECDGLRSQIATFFPKTRFRPFDISYIYPHIWYKTALKICIFEKIVVPLHSQLQQC